MIKQLLSLVGMSAALLLGGPTWAYGPTPALAGPGTGGSEVNSPWFQVDMNWRAALGPKDIASTAAAQRSISCIWAADSADAGPLNNFSRAGSQVNFADANFNAAQWPDNGNKVAWGDIFGYRCVPYSGAWNLAVRLDVVSGTKPVTPVMSGPKLSRAMLLLAGLGLLLFVA
ncbi:MAG TPA: hypothetical protein VEP67_00060, partial [Thiobacillaceae bacterium]|nr:hypothetical protein [Thiobacillaceae bacterium]